MDLKNEKNFYTMPIIQDIDTDAMRIPDLEQSVSLLIEQVQEMTVQIQQRDKDILTLSRNLDEATRLIQCLTDVVLTRNALIADIKASQPRIRQRLTRLERMHAGSK